MPKPMTVGDVPTTDLQRTLASSGKGKKYKLQRGSEAINTPRSTNILVFGGMGTGKTYLLVQLLKLGKRIVAINTDFGKTGINTVYNYFNDHPEEKHFLENFYVIELDLNGVLDFCRNPKMVIDEIYAVDPDILFWDGLTAFQMADLESDICNGDFLREDSTWADWRKTQNGTIFPLMAFLGLKNEVSNKPWTKIVTTLEQEKGKKRSTGSVGNDKQKMAVEIIPGTEKTGPMLHTTARDLAGAGFDIVLQTVKKTIAGQDQFFYLSRGADLMIKDRGYGLPEKMNGDFGAVWSQFIQPKLGGALGETAQQ